MPRSGLQRRGSKSGAGPGPVPVPVPAPVANPVECSSSSPITTIPGGSYSANTFAKEQSGDLHVSDL